MKKIDWDKVWDRWEIWYDRTGWKTHSYVLDDMKRKIQSLVEAQLKRKKHGHK